MDHLHHLTLALREHAQTVRGQLIGLAMIVFPAVTNPLPFGRIAHATIQILAVVVGSAGALIVFGGLVERAFLPGRDSADRPEAVSPDPPGEAVSLEDALRGVPHARAVWVGLALLGLGLVLGAAWCLTLAVTRDWAEHLADVTMLGLPAVAVIWAAWRARAMRTHP